MKEAFRNIWADHFAGKSCIRKGYYFDDRVENAEADLKEILPNASDKQIIKLIG